MNHRRQVFKGISIFFLLLMVVYLGVILFVKDEWSRVAIVDLIDPVFSLLPGIFLFQAAWQTTPHSRKAGAAWLVLAVSLCFITMGDLAWIFLDLSAQEILHLSTADIFYLSSYLLFGLGILLFPHKCFSAGERCKVFLDFCILLIATFLVFWNILIIPHIQWITGESLLTQIRLVSYPIGDMMMLCALVSLVYRQIVEQDRRPIMLLAGSTLLYIIADSFFSIQALGGSFTSDNIAGLGWAGASFFYMQAAFLQIRLTKGQEIPETSLNRLVFKSMAGVENLASYSPYFFGLAAFLSIILGHQNNFYLGFWKLASLIGVLFVLIIIRQGIFIWENKRLTGNLGLALQQVQEKSGELERINRNLQNEIREHKVAKQQLLYKAMHDPLTGMPNRAYLLDRLKYIIEITNNHIPCHYAVLYLDCDHFKVVNDSMGHNVGDQLLVDIALRLKSCMRSSDLVGRIGGDEFVIVLAETQSLDNISAVINRIQDEFRKPFHLINRQRIFISTSIGVVEHVEEYSQAEDVLRDADIAMYYAKAGGKARYEVFNPGMREKIIARLQMEHDIRAALERDELELHYQPILALKNQQLIGFEALIRWRHPSKGLLLPSDFIPICEETGIIHDVGAWVLREACGQIKKWRSLNPNFRNITMHVNVSGKQFISPGFFQEISSVLDKTGLEPEALRLEITESVFMENTENAIGMFWKLKQIGIESEIDDFGTGYSSLGYLKNFPVQAIKIDRTFINLINPGEKPEVVNAILKMIHQLGISAIAEGIETDYQLKKLVKMGCTYGQGYFISTPLALQSAEQYLTRCLS